MGDTEIREAVHGDVSALVSLINRAYRGESSRRGWTTEADLLGGLRIDEAGLAKILDDPDSVVLLVEKKERIIASVHARHTGKQVHLGLFAVDPVLQGEGIGTQLLHYAESEAKRRWGVQAAVMEVISRRDELIAYYERHGYRPTGEIVPFPVSKLWSPFVESLEMSVLCKLLS